MERLMGFAGLATMLALAYLFSANRRAIRLKTVAVGLGLQFVFALFVLRTDTGRALFATLGAVVTRFLHLSWEGSRFIFGQLGVPDSAFATSYGSVFAFVVLPTIIFVAAFFAILYHYGVMQQDIRGFAWLMTRLMEASRAESLVGAASVVGAGFFAILYHYGVMQQVIRGFAWLMTRLMAASGAEALVVAASVFGMGQTETPLTIRPYLNKLTESELMTVMTSGFAHIAGGVMAAYILFGAEARHLLTAVVMTAPGTILLAKMFIPETGKPQTAGVVKVEIERPDPNVLGAAARGTTDGLYLALNVAAMLVAFLALIAFVNWVLGGAHDTLAWLGFAYFPASLQEILGWVFSPVAWLLGVPWSEATTVGNLLGLRMVTNEFIA